MFLARSKYPIKFKKPIKLQNAISKLIFDKFMYNNSIKLIEYKINDDHDDKFNKNNINLSNAMVPIEIIIFWNILFMGMMVNSIILWILLTLFTFIITKLINLL